MLIDWPEDLPNAVIGDPTRYTQIIINLVSNAVKFTARGHIRLRVSLVTEQDLALVVRFEVEDTGIGIRSDVIPRLFESFMQADSSTTRQYGGTGLGLAIVRRLCQLKGGDCGVSSEFGKGSCFWFTLTLQRNSHATQPGESEVASAGAGPAPAAFKTARKLNVLVVEDNLVNQMVACGILEAAGCACTTVDDGQKAVAALTAAHEYDIVLMDCHMPVMDGWEATRRVRAHESGTGSRTPIVALTANAMAGDRETCLAAGMDDFLSKPFQMHELTRMLNTWCPPPG